MEQLGRITKTNEDGTAQVLLIEKAACSGDCLQCSGCGGAQERRFLTARNSIQAKAGEVVTVKGKSNGILPAAAVLCGMPFALFFIGYSVGQRLWHQGALTGLCGFALGILSAWRYDRSVFSKQKTVYTITGYGDPMLLFWENEDKNLD